MEKVLDGEIWLVPVSQRLARDDADGWGEHEDHKTIGQADTDRRCDHRDSRNIGARDQQVRVECAETTNQIVVERVEQSQKPSDGRSYDQYRADDSDTSVVFDEERGDVQSRTRRDKGGPDEVL